MSLICLLYMSYTTPIQEPYINLSSTPISKQSFFYINSKYIIIVLLAYVVEIYYICNAVVRLQT